MLESMPLFNSPSRRDVLRTIGAGAVVAMRGSSATSSTRWALLSDTHLPSDVENEYRGFRPYQNLTRVIPEVARIKPDGVIIDGDLARLEGLPADYERLKSMLDPLLDSTACGFTLGNHDHRKNFQTAFGAPRQGRPQPVRDKHVVVIEQAPVRLVLLDSLLLCNQVPGLLGKAQRQWLESYLQSANGTPTLLFLHHTLDDGDGSLLDSDRFLKVALGNSNVKAIFYGHSHRYAYDVQNGVHLVNLPAVGYNFQDSEPVGWVNAAFSKEGAELTLHAIAGSRESDGKTRSLAWR